MEAFECAEGASSAGRAADEGGVVLLSPVHTQLTVESRSPRAEKRTVAAAYTLFHSKRLQWRSRSDPAGYGLQQGVSSLFSPMVAPS